MNYYYNNKIISIIILLFNVVLSHDSNTNILNSYDINKLSINESKLIKSFSTNDTIFMNRAIELATKAIGQTSPNPCVGCVIVSLNGTIVGEGYHERAGLPHAEVGAIKQAGELARDGTAYVSLEPCNHYGRTPPCTLALIKCGIKRVIAGIVDPDPRVSGKGLAFLASQGVEIGIGLQESECIEINLPFIYRILYNRSYITTWSIINNKDLTSCQLIDTDCLNINSLKYFDTIVLPLDQLNDINISELTKHFPSYSNIILIDSYNYSIPNDSKQIINQLANNELSYDKIYYYDSSIKSILSINESFISNNYKSIFNLSSLIEVSYNKFTSNSLLLLGYKDLFIESTKFQRAIVSKINYDTDITSEYISNDFCNDVIENDTGVQSESTITSNATVNNKRIVTFSRKLWVYQSKYLSKD